MDMVKVTAFTGFKEAERVTTEKATHVVLRRG